MNISRREIAQQDLIKNIVDQNYYPEKTHLPSKEKNSDNIRLPSYIPYIGAHYFNTYPKILCYAINQNLSKHAPWAKQWIGQWKNNFDEAINRLNIAALKGIAIPIKPYAEGFIPLIALIAFKIWPTGNDDQMPKYIDDVIAVTNFVKYSTFADASSSSIPQSWWEVCGEKFVKKEIQTLTPDLIIAFGNKTFEELAKILKSFDQKPELIKCRFPARIASNKSRILSIDERKIWNNEVAPLIQRINCQTNKNYHKFKIKQYPGYFIDFYKSIQ